MTLLCKKMEEVKTEWSLAESFKDDCGSKKGSFADNDDDDDDDDVA
jgi:hypothetical protein